VAVVVVLGFPVAMVLSWIFDIVPDDEEEGDEAAGSSFRSATQMEGQHLAHYEILERLGVGGMGVVYKARDTRLNRVVAFKVLSDHLLSDADAKERFLVEARAAAALDHPNICAIHEIGETDDGRFYISMQFYEGETLRQRIDKGPLPLPLALDIAAQISRGLVQAAEQEIIHRDIKPANIIITADGTIKIVDFGLAKFAGTLVTKTGVGIGTVAYMSPEQTRGDKVDQRTDVWSIGVVLFEMLTGTRPYRGGSDQAVINAILNGKQDSLGKLIPAMPDGVVTVVERAMQIDPQRRYADAAAFLGDIEQLLDDPGCQVSFDSTPSLPAEGERRRVTVIACSIGGFETLLESLDPDEIESTLDRLRQGIESVVENYGGELHEFSEEQCVALFGVPITHEDDQLRAVRASLEIRNEKAIVPDGVTLRFAVGSEQVAIRAIDSGDRRYRVGGKVVRDTTRLASLAAADEILIPPNLARIVESFVSTEGRDVVELTPDHEAMTPLAVISESSQSHELQVTAPDSITRFVGRNSELGALSQALSDANSGAGRFITVIGDIGVGKSRLLLEFWKSLEDTNVRSTVGRCQERGSFTPLLPFIDNVKDILGINESETGNAHDEVVNKIRTLSPQLENYVPLILQLLSIDSDEFPLPSYLEGEDLKTALGEALISVFTLGSAGQPLVMLLEDWHWADDSSKAVLFRLREMVSANALLVIVTSRPIPFAERAMPGGDLHLELAALGTGPAAELLSASLNGAKVPADLSTRIAEKTGGNPFFIEELCRTLMESGTIVIENNKAQLAKNIDRLLIPDTVQAVLKSRIDRLDPEAREVLRCAAVIGKQFGLELLSRVVPSRSRIKGALATLQSAGLLQQTGLVPEPTYRFKHALTLDVTYESLLDRQRKERHALVGDAMEGYYSEQVDEHSAELAVHFAAAENWDKAIRYGRAAATRAENLWRLPETVETLMRTRGWIERSDRDVAERNKMLVEVLFSLERHLERLGRRDEQQTMIDDLKTILPADVPSKERGEVCVRQGDLRTLLAQFADARPQFDEALLIAEQIDDAELGGKVLRSLGHMLWRQGNYQEAIPWLEQAVDHARERADKGSLLPDMCNLGRALRKCDQYDRAMKIGEEALQLSAETDNPVDKQYAHNYMGHLLRAMGRTDDAIAEFEAAVADLHDARMPERSAFNKLGAAALYLEKGELDVGLAAYEDAVQMSRRADRTDLLAQSLQLHAEALINCGRLEDAVPKFEEAVTVLRRINSGSLLATAMVQLARAQQSAGDPRAAHSWRQVAELQEQLGDQRGTLLALERVANLRRNTDQTDAQDLYNRALDLATELLDWESEARIRNGLALIAWQGKDLTEAEDQYGKAAELLQQNDGRRELGVILNGLGAVLTQMNRETEALTVLEEALAANREFGHDGAEGDSLSALGAAWRVAGESTESGTWYQQCVDKRREMGDRAGEGWALQRLSEVMQESGETQQALAFSSAALAIGRETNDKTLESLANELQSASSK
jgi:serine/threonine protein kinase/tetratricopeptide (TPR) repeat protein